DSRSLSERFPQLKGSNPEDSKNKFFEDTVRGGKFLSDQELVKIHVEDAPDRLQDLIDWGTKLGEIWKASGHSYPRGVYIPGTKLMPVLKRKTLAVGVQLYEDVMITDILTNNGRAVGAIGIDIKLGHILVFKAKATILATGGAMRVYPLVTAPEELTGDGMAMAYRAGAELANMEFPMFLPGCFVFPKALAGADVPFQLSTEGWIQGYLLNKKGERFMVKWSPETMEHTTRDITSIAMMSEVLDGNGSPHGGVYVSLKHLPDNLIDYMHTWLKWLQDKGYPWTYGGFDLADFIPKDYIKNNALEAAAASHFTNGGIRINGKCETNIPGLYASGETTAGVHGGNRLSGNAFTEMIVWGHRSGKFAAEYVKGAPASEVDPAQVKTLKEKILKPLEGKQGENPIEFRKQLQDLAWTKVGVVRDGPLLVEAEKEIQELLDNKVSNLVTKTKDRRWNREWIEAVQAENMTLILLLTAKASIMRTESRGALYRRDHPMTDYDGWTKNIIVKLVDGKPHLSTVPANITTLKPPKGKVKYGVVE
ncbi:MAG: FAD-binding protein, partial [Candidatus Ranarchaeia archaeon]